LLDGELPGHRAQALAPNPQREAIVRRGYWYRSGGNVYIVAFDRETGDSQTWESSSLAEARKLAVREGIALTPQK